MRFARLRYARQSSGRPTVLCRASSKLDETQTAILFLSNQNRKILTCIICTNTHIGEHFGRRIFMSYTILYNTMFLRSGEGITPCVLSGSNNCYDA